MTNTQQNGTARKIAISSILVLLISMFSFVSSAFAATTLTEVKNTTTWQDAVLAGDALPSDTLIQEIIDNPAVVDVAVIDVSTQLKVIGLTVSGSRVDNLDGTFTYTADFYAVGPNSTTVSLLVYDSAVPDNYTYTEGASTILDNTTTTTTEPTTDTGVYPVITSADMDPLKNTVINNTSNLLPIGLTILATMIGISLIPRIFYKFF